MLSLFSLNTFKWISLGNVEPNPTNSHSFLLNPQHDQPSYMHFPINLSMANLKVPFPPLPITVLTDLASLSTRKSNSKPKQTSTRYKEGGLRAFAGFLLVAGGGTSADVLSPEPPPLSARRVSTGDLVNFGLVSCLCLYKWADETQERLRMVARPALPLKGTDSSQTTLHLR